jgi:hypothetical protein
MEQLLFPFEQDETALHAYLQKSTRTQISLVITDNICSMLSFREKGGRIALRLHNMFLSAGSDVLDEIACYITGRRRNTPRITEFINAHSHRLRQRSARNVKYRTRGKQYNLLEMYDEINNEYFNGGVSASITWGSKGPRRAARNRTLGSYAAHGNVIRINPILDNKRVPRYFVEFIVYHEMLHADIGIEKNGSRRSVHSQDFKRRERVFKHYDKAISWEKKHW